MLTDVTTDTVIKSGEDAVKMANDTWNLSLSARHAAPTQIHDRGVDGANGWREPRENACRGEADRPIRISRS